MHILEWPADDTAIEELIVKIVCFNKVTTQEGTKICGAVQMTGFQYSQHTMRFDRPCDGCGEAGHYDGVGDNRTVEGINSDVKPIREF